MNDREYLRELITAGLDYLGRMDEAQCAAMAGTVRRFIAEQKPRRMTPKELNAFLVTGLSDHMAQTVAAAKRGRA